MPDQAPELLTDDELRAASVHGWIAHDTSAGERSNLWGEFAARASTELLAARARIDRVTDLFEKWAAEESEHRAAGEYGLAEGLHVAIEELRMAVHGTHEEPYRA